MMKTLISPTYDGPAIDGERRLDPALRQIILDLDILESPTNELGLPAHVLDRVEAVDDDEDSEFDPDDDDDLADLDDDDEDDFDTDDDDDFGDEDDEEDDDFADAVQ